ncbi:reticulocalbin-2 [Tetranychus urticae]|uniref:Reticulocalbin-3 n=1 Tax=Tetranychus urticae TaxID=32264 RepID=T1JWT5_TETUR|nr:reticulocalbin-2 [Tetranychus urticae]
MNFKLSEFILLVIALQPTLSAHVHSHNKERVDDGFGSVNHFATDGSHNSEYDHQAVLGSKKEAAEYDELPPEESQRRLRILVTKGGMDADTDGFVSKEELTQWVFKSFESLASEEGIESFNEEDTNKDGYVSWDEHINYNFEADELQFKDTNEMIHEDKILFKAADINNDGKLDVTEFPAFNSPEDFVSMHEALYQITMEKKDKNNDGALDFSEFIRDERGGIPEPKSEIYIIEKERFSKDFDLDKNGKLDKKETLLWLVPDIRETAASEADHLLTTCDDDGDGKLSVEEIVSHYDVFVGSEATDFGDHLHKINPHDEL